MHPALRLIFRRRCLNFINVRTAYASKIQTPPTKKPLAQPGTTRFREYITWKGREIVAELVNEEKSLYLRVYHYYRELIRQGRMTEGSRLPSIRQCAAQLQISRTTVESAYLQLAADGYVIARPQSGYYVTGRHTGENNDAAVWQEEPETLRIRYDFSSGSVDRESFDFGIWRRYIKSALRQDERLLSYGEPQGERELREALAGYLAQTRNVICRPDQIVVGAGTQCLLQMLCPMLKTEKVVSFPSLSMVQPITVFRDYAYEIHRKDKDAAVIYVSPSRMNRMGDVMPVSRRLELLRHAEQNKSLIIEDDYESEFGDSTHPVPSLYGLAGGHGVVYLGTCSRLLLPSIRISYMVLPDSLEQTYQKRCSCLNQTASKAEQIALGQFIRDGHMEATIRRLRRLYRAKTKRLYQALSRQITEPGRLQEHNLCVTAALKPEIDLQALTEAAREAGICFDGVETDAAGICRIVLSSLTIPAEQIEEAAAAAAKFLI